MVVTSIPLDSLATTPHSPAHEDANSFHPRPNVHPTALTTASPFNDAFNTLDLSLLCADDEEAFIAEDKERQHDLQELLDDMSVKDFSEYDDDEQTDFTDDDLDFNRMNNNSDCAFSSTVVSNNNNRDDNTGNGNDDSCSKPYLSKTSPVPLSMKDKENDEMSKSGQTSGKANLASTSPLSSDLNKSGAVTPHISSPENASPSLPYTPIHTTTGNSISPLLPVVNLNSDVTDDVKRTCHPLEHIQVPAVSPLTTGQKYSSMVMESHKTSSVPDACEEDASTLVLRRELSHTRIELEQCRRERERSASALEISQKDAASERSRRIDAETQLGKLWQDYQLIGAQDTSPVALTALRGRLLDESRREAASLRDFASRADAFVERARAETAASIESAKAECKAFRSEIADLTSELNKLQTLYAAKMRQHAVAQREHTLTMEGGADRVHVLVQRLQMETRDREMLNRQHSQLNEDFAALRKRFEHTETALAETRDTLNKTVEAKNEAVAGWNAAAIAVDDARAELRGLRVWETASEGRAIATADREVSRLRELHVSEKATLKADIDRLNEALVSATEISSARVNAAEADAVTARQALDEYRLSHAATVEELTIALENAQNRLQEFLSRDISQEMADLRIRHSEAVADVDRLTKRIEVLTEELGEARGMVDALERACPMAGEHVHLVGPKALPANGDILALRHELRASIASSQAKLLRMNELRKGLAEMVEAKDELLGRVSQQHGVLEGYDATVKGLRSELVAMANRYSESTSALDTALADVSSMSEELSATKAALITAENSEAVSRQNAKESQAELSRLNANLQCVNEKVEDIEAKLSERVAEAVEVSKAEQQCVYTAEIARFHDESSARIIAVRSECSEEISQFRSALAAAVSETKDARERYIALNNEFKEAEKNTSAIITALESALEQAKKRETDFQETLKRSSAETFESVSLNATIADLKMNLKHARDDIEFLHDELKASSAEAKALKKDAEASREASDLLQEQLDESYETFETILETVEMRHRADLNAWRARIDVAVEAAAVEHDCELERAIERALLEAKAASSADEAILRHEMQERHDDVIRAMKRDIVAERERFAKRVLSDAATDHNKALVASRDARERDLLSIVELLRFPDEISLSESIVDNENEALFLKESDIVLFSSMDVSNSSISVESMSDGEVSNFVSSSYDDINNFGVSESPSMVKARLEIQSKVRLLFSKLSMLRTYEKTLRDRDTLLFDHFTQSTTLCRGYTNMPRILQSLFQAPHEKRNEKTDTFICETSSHVVDLVAAIEDIASTREVAARQDAMAIMLRIKDRYMKATEKMKNDALEAHRNAVNRIAMNTKLKV